ncbi:MAG: hypothetical protein BGP25_04995 [Lysobacterales bacterium 63-13]|nr:MAG: hypothetical protein BGP25_04995 [Xanthomonadales bacterium 63-13]
MGENSPKDRETIQGHLSAIEALASWLEREAGTQRIPQIVSLLVADAGVALRANRPPPAVEVESLAQRYFDTHGGSLRGEPAGKWLRRGRMEGWWRARERQIAMVCERAGSAWVPHLVIRSGGGRGNSTEYAIAFRPLDTESEPEPVECPTPKGRVLTTIHYDVNPAQAAWWVGWLSAVPQFHVRSWRGWALLGLVGMAFAWVALATVIVGLSMWHDRPISGRDFVAMAVVGSIAWVLWRVLRSICVLPWQRVTLAPDSLLRYDQLHAQFRLTRNTQSRALGGWFSLVRHWGTCPLCSAEVDLCPGADAFPGRVVGRCADSPLEHVYSFDPVTLSGCLLITESASVSPGRPPEDQP